MDGYDASLEVAATDRRRGSLLTLGGEGIHILSAESLLSGNHISRDTYRGDRVFCSQVRVVLVSRQIGLVGQRHHFYATGYHQIVLTRRDAVGAELGGHQA